jgi:hypothetical protein
MVASCLKNRHFIGCNSPAVMAVVLTVVTISFQAIRAATANPVKKLRSE